MLFSSVCKNISFNCAKLFANNTFLDNPNINLLTPAENLLNVVFLFSNCFSISTYLTIGPAINCGNKDIYSANFNNDFCTSAFPLYKSIR